VRVIEKSDRTEEAVIVEGRKISTYPQQTREFCTISHSSWSEFISCLFQLSSTNHTRQASELSLLVPVIEASS
jgi:hypothetical protein